MTRENIIHMAQESGLAEVLSKYDGEYGHDNSKETAGFLELERFALLVAAAEREACLALVNQGTGEATSADALKILRMERDRISAAIRARGET